MKPDILRQTFGDKLHRARNGADLSVLDLSERTGFPPDYIAQIENGDFNVPPSTLAALASVLGRDVASILRS